MQRITVNPISNGSGWMWPSAFRNISGHFENVARLPCSTTIPSFPSAQLINHAVAVHVRRKSMRLDQEVMEPELNSAKGSPRWLLLYTELR
jgi:hypothetical protein